MVFFQHSGDSIELLFHVIYSNDPSQSFYDSGALSPYQHVHCSGSGDVLQSSALFSFVKTKGTLFSVCICAFILVLPPHFFVWNEELLCSWEWPWIFESPTSKCYDSQHHTRLKWYWSSNRELHACWTSTFINWVTSSALGITGRL